MCKNTKIVQQLENNEIQAFLIVFMELERKQHSERIKKGISFKKAQLNSKDNKQKGMIL